MLAFVAIGAAASKLGIYLIFEGPEAFLPGARESFDVAIVVAAGLCVTPVAAMIDRVRQRGIRTAEA